MAAPAHAALHDAVLLRAPVAALEVAGHSVRSEAVPAHAAVLPHVAAPALHESPHAALREAVPVSPLHQPY